MSHLMWVLFLNAVLVHAAGIANIHSAGQLQNEGQSLFLAGEYKHAARAFEKAVAQKPDSAALHYWLGKSYSRLAEQSSLLTAPRAARKARRSLELAVRMDRRSDEYLLELLDFYVDSPEWLVKGGLVRAAALLEEIGSERVDKDLYLRRLADSRKDHSGGSWLIRRGILSGGGAAGILLPGK